MKRNYNVVIEKVVCTEDEINTVDYIEDNQWTTNIADAKRIAAECCKRIEDSDVQTEIGYGLQVSIFIYNTSYEIVNVEEFKTYPHPEKFKCKKCENGFCFDCEVNV